MLHSLSSVVLSVVGVIITLAWFMSVVLRWPLGPVDVLGLIVFVGYSVTYAIHIAHKYKEHAAKTSPDLTPQERRAEAVSLALRAMVSAVAGSAATTLGASFFLFFCFMQIFVKLATVLFAETFFAAIFSVVALPASLLCVGPLGYCSWCHAIARLCMPSAWGLVRRASQSRYQGSEAASERKLDEELQGDCPSMDLRAGSSVRRSLVGRFRAPISGRHPFGLTAAGARSSPRLEGLDSVVLVDGLRSASTPKPAVHFAPVGGGARAGRAPAPGPAALRPQTPPAGEKGSISSSSLGLMPPRPALAATAAAAASQTRSSATASKPSASLGALTPSGVPALTGPGRGATPPLKAVSRTSTTIGGRP